VVENNANNISVEREIIKLSKNSKRCMLTINKFNQKLLLTCLVKQLDQQTPDYNITIRSINVLSILKLWIGSVINPLPSLVNLIPIVLPLVCRLVHYNQNPSVVGKDLQDEILLIITWILRSFPMCDYHNETNRFAVGLETGVIKIWKLDGSGNIDSKELVGHNGAISTVAFHSDGKLLASFSEVDGVIITWKIGVSSIASLFGVSQKKSKSSVRKLTTIPPNSSYVVRSRMFWRNEKNIILIRFQPIISFSKGKKKSDFLNNYNPESDFENAIKIKEIWVKTPQKKNENLEILKKLNASVDNIIISDK
jgi:WD40 repeat protein